VQLNPLLPGLTSPSISFSLQSVEVVLSALLQNYSCEFSARDVYRMELIVMQKLDFKLTNHTPYDFLKIVSLLFAFLMLLGQVGAGDELKKLPSASLVVGKAPFNILMTLSQWIA